MPSKRQYPAEDIYQLNCFNNYIAVLCWIYLTYRFSNTRLLLTSWKLFKHAKPKAREKSFDKDDKDPWAGY